MQSNESIHSTVQVLGGPSASLVLAAQAGARPRRCGPAPCHSPAVLPPPPPVFPKIATQVRRPALVPAPRFVGTAEQRRGLTVASRGALPRGRRGAAAEAAAGYGTVWLDAPVRVHVSLGPTRMRRRCRRSEGAGMLRQARRRPIGMCQFQYSRARP